MGPNAIMHDARLLCSSAAMRSSTSLGSVPWRTDRMAGGWQIQQGARVRDRGCGLAGVDGWWLLLA